MRVIQTTGTTDENGMLTLILPLGQPLSKCDVAVVVTPFNPMTSNEDSWAAINAIRERLAMSGRTFTDSVELIREDRDR